METVGIIIQTNHEATVSPSGPASDVAASSLLVVPSAEPVLPPLEVLLLDLVVVHRFNQPLLSFFTPCFICQAL